MGNFFFKKFWAVFKLMVKLSPHLNTFLPGSWGRRSPGWPRPFSTVQCSGLSVLLLSVQSPSDSAGAGAVLAAWGRVTCQMTLCRHDEWQGPFSVQSPYNCVWAGAVLAASGRVTCQMALCQHDAWRGQGYPPGYRLAGRCLMAIILQSIT